MMMRRGDAGELGNGFISSDTPLLTLHMWYNIAIGCCTSTLVRPTSTSWWSLPYGVTTLTSLYLLLRTDLAEVAVGRYSSQASFSIAERA